MASQCQENGEDYSSVLWCPDEMAIIYLHAIVVCSPSCMINIIAARLLYSMHTNYSAYLHKT